MSAIGMGRGINLLKIGAAVTVLTTEVIVAVAILVVMFS